MNPVYRHLYLDLHHKTIDSINLKQYDHNGEYIIFHITDNGTPYRLISGTQAEIKIQKPDDTKIVNFANVDCDNNHVIVEITSQITAIYGVLHSDITLFKEGMVISTMPFLLNVEKSPIQNEDVESSDEYGVLENLIVEIQLNEEQRQINEEVRKEAENDRNAKEELRKNNENTRIENEIARKEAEKDRDNNEDIRIKNEENRVLNEETRKMQEKNREEMTSAAILDAQTATQATINATTDLQHKLDSHHFVLTEDKSVADGVAALDTNGKIPDGELYVATTSRKGITQLTNSVTSNSTTTAATPSSVKTVYDAIVEVDKQKHTHDNKSVLDGITATAIGKWNAAADRADTWRGIQDNLNSTSTVDSLSANQGRVLKEMIDNKLSASIPWSKVTGKPGSYPPSAHTHDDRYYTETEVNNLLGGKANNSHSHDDRYYTESEVNNLLATKAASNHSHSITWNDISGKPSMGQWSDNKNSVALVRGNNLVSSALVNITGWFFVSAVARIRDSLSATDVIGIYLSTSDSPQYLEWWSNANSVSAPRSCHMLQATGIFHLNAKQFINLSMWASTTCVMEGIRFNWTLLAPG